MTGPRNYDPSRDWHTAGGDGGPGIVVFRYELNDATDLTYTKATGGLTHKDDNGDVYHIFVGPTFGGPAPGGPSFANANVDFTVSPGSPFPTGCVTSWWWRWRWCCYFT